MPELCNACGMPNDERFMPLRRAARLLGVPIAWLKDEAEAGRVPSIRVGRRLMFSVADVEQALRRRSQEVPA